MKTELIPVAQIQARIHSIRGKRVMLDADLARFYGVTTFNLNKAVGRNMGRFPEDFAFVLTQEEMGDLKFQSGISSSQPEEGEVIKNSGKAMAVRASQPGLSRSRVLPCWPVYCVARVP